ncbi:hypothetical protein [Aquipuribacter sp. MA13-6]|uniref:hypothetical protein n=1 Tax=unclassified Aquipuribacter TaxID=2635084 RepID=UPI003EE95EBF
MVEAQQAVDQTPSEAHLGVARESVAFVPALGSAVALSQLLFLNEAGLGLWGAFACGMAAMGAYVVREKGKWRRREKALQTELDRAASAPERRSASPGPH